ncbi:endoplasmic oxidoreductin [Anaeromyces robustus]|uniref:Endoplasmic oxidoreductin n=1 Tax=Anaeromyces robustus TaxID=1754192 RepID=A0A1Y1XBL2_9FUNG|nr:endoplasmic oxidoreductin [Anaeromyces robustus]|eukprot:ORX82806.1 endoplasmic oxidoreductin [Anaeromyces robustus]
MRFKYISLLFGVSFLTISKELFYTNAEKINTDKSPADQQSELRSDKKDLGYCCFQGTISDSCCEYESVETMNKELSSTLNELVQTTFFRYYKVDLWKECPFWPDAGLLCTSERCSVPSVEKNKIPEEWSMESLSKVEKSSIFSSLSSLNACDYSSKDFCIFDEESEGLRYVDLPTNPERFTGYQGEPANRVWASIYKENCFGVPSHNKEAESCSEKRVFFKLISGLHTSISTHVCYDWLDVKSGVWSPNLDCFIWKIGKFPDRIENLYLNYAIYIRAISKISNYLEKYHYCNGSEEEDLKVTKLMKKVTSIANQYPPTFDESKFFSSSETRDLIDDIRFQFRNVSRIMDCVSCEKCRLWGKIQITGLGTALKILFSLDKEIDGISLKRTEIVSLINAFAKLSSSLNVIDEFRDMWRKRDEKGMKLVKRKIEEIASTISDKLKLNDYTIKAKSFTISKFDYVLTKIQEFLKDQNLMDDSDNDDRNRVILLIGGAFITILIGVLLVLRLIYNIIYEKFIHKHQHHHTKHHLHHHHKQPHHLKNVTAFKKEN